MSSESLIDDMTSWKDKIKNAIFEEDEKDSSEKVQSPGVPKPVIPNSAVPISDNNVEVNDELLDKIEKEIRGADLPGPDYLELKEAAEEKSLIQDEPDEGKRWRQAYRNMRVFFPQANITKDKILQAIDHYIEIVDREKKIGLQELEEARRKNVIKEQEDSDRLGQEILNLESQIKIKRQEKEEKDRKIQESRNKYDGQEKIFVKTIEFVRNMLNRDKSKINNYINE